MTLSDGPKVSSQATRTVYFVDDEADVRKSLFYALSPSGITVWPFSDPQDFLDELDALSPAPILLDVRMPEIDGIQLLAMIREHEIEWPVIMVSAHGDVKTAVSAMKHGAVDFLEKPFRIEELESLLEAAFDQLAKSGATEKKRESARAKLSLLTSREAEVVDRMAKGMTNNAIAEDLGISPRTIEIHRKSLLGKLRCKNAAMVVRLMVEAGEL